MQKESYSNEFKMKLKAWARDGLCSKYSICIARVTNC